jgi:hypothetical protein
MLHLILAVTGWVLIGEARVDGRNDRETIDASRLERFEKLVITAPDRVRVRRMVVVLEDGREVALRADDGRLVDLPGGARAIDKIVLTGDARGRRGARVEVWGLVARDDAWDADRFERIGRIRAAGRHGVVRFTPPHRGRGALSVVPSDPRLEVVAVTVRYAGGHRVRLVPDEDAPRGLRAAIAIPATDAPIAAIAVRYARRGRGRPGAIDLFARR